MALPAQIGIGNLGDIEIRSADPHNRMAVRPHMPVRAVDARDQDLPQQQRHLATEHVAEFLIGQRFLTPSLHCDQRIHRGSAGLTTRGEPPQQLVRLEQRRSCIDLAVDTGAVHRHPARCRNADRSEKRAARDQGAEP
ncbi:hypothetical protein M1M07_13060 [Rhodococcus sp. HM1]|nr:hypothetical protein [Rhodococcus sp. HM1]MCK8672044.1 hypothetical protein [Rhodococcus sp. HM1]